MNTKSHSREFFLAPLLVLVVLMALGATCLAPIESDFSVRTFAQSQLPNDTGFGAFLSEHSSADCESPRSLSASCPSPFVDQAGTCVLLAPATTNTTIAPSSNSTFDCQNNVLSAARSGSAIDPWPSARSSPEVAFFLNGVQNVTIRKCILNGFDFGVFAIDSKDPGVLMQSANTRVARAKRLPFIPIKVIDNTITARFAAITLMTVDKAEITGNTLTYTAKGGRALFVGRNSDANILQKNKIVANFLPSQNEAVTVPGPFLSTNPKLNASAAVVVTQILGAEPTLLNAIIEGELYQITIPGVARSEDPVPPPRPDDFSQGNVIDTNLITYPTPAAGATPPAGNDGIVISVSRDSVVIDNQIWYAAAAIRGGIQIGTGGVKQLPGKCAKDGTRLCLQASDCNIKGFDNQDLGGCLLPAPTKVFWLATGNTIERNYIYGPFATGILLAAARTRVHSNHIDGDPSNLTSGAWKGTAITLLGKYALDELSPQDMTAITTVTENVIQKVDAGFLLQQVFEEESRLFATKVYLNNVTDYVAAVRTRYTQPSTMQLYNLASELSFNGKGNYWGPCPPGFDPNKVRNIENGTTNTFVTDKNVLCKPLVRVQPPRPETRATKPTRRQPKRLRPT